MSVAGQVVDLQPDQGPLDDRQVAGVVEPAGAAGQPRVDPIPGGRGRRPVVAGRGAGHRVRCGPGRGVGEGQFGAVVAGASDGGRESWRCRQPHDPVGPQPAQHVDGQVGQDVGESGDVVAGVDDDQDPRIGGRVVSGGDQAFDYAADLDRGDVGDVVGG